MLSELMHELDPGRSDRHETLRAPQDLLDALDLHDIPGTAAAARAALAGVLSTPRTHTGSASRRPGRTAPGRRSARCGWKSDADMPGGEALARQLGHGKRFFFEEPGVETAETRLPDSFGCTAAFPQLAKLAGIRWFLTQKLSWNQPNRVARGFEIRTARLRRASGATRTPGPWCRCG